VTASRLDSAGCLTADAWKVLADSLRRHADRPLVERLAEVALSWTAARSAVLFIKEREGWIRAAGAGDPARGPLSLPEPLPERSIFSDGVVWLPLVSEGEVHGYLGLEGVAPEETDDLAVSLGLLFGGQTGAYRFSRLVKEAEFEVKTRLLELESLYDLGLSLSGQLEISSLADEVLFRSISLTDAGKGTLVLFHEDGRILSERSLGGEFLPVEQVRHWKLPEGEVTVNNAAASTPTAGLQLSSCEKCLAVAISVGGRRLGVLAVADKESRDGGVLDFTTADARLLSLFANQAGAAIETARLHREAIEKERIERELELAAAIQREILPRALPVVPGLELAAANLPTRHVGGDYYDVLPLSQGRVGFLVADVSGKGVPAALLVSTVHAAVHLQIEEASSIADLVQRIDRHLRRYAATRKFLTLFFGVLEPESGKLRYVSAGHNPAILLRRSGSIDRVESTGVPLGLLPDTTWREQSLQLDPGDLLALYTDGVTEAVNEADEEFGWSRLCEAVGESDARQRPVRDLCDTIMSRVADFASGMPQYDDQTLLLVRRS
jgi:sigma-B regulation protein RsbU (phosphoserine phosphatase)